MAAASKVRTTADDAPGTTRNKEDFLQLRKLVSCLFFLSLAYGKQEEIFFSR